MHEDELAITKSTNNLPAPLTKRTENGSKLTVPADQMLIPLLDHEVQQLASSHSLAQNNLKTAQTALLHTDGSFVEVANTIKGTASNQQSSTLTELIQTVQTGKRGQQEETMWGFFTIHTRQDTMSREKASTEQFVSTRQSNHSLTDEQSIHQASRVAHLGRGATPESVRQVTESFESALDAGAIFNPFQAKRLLDERMAYLSSVLTIMINQNDRPDLIQAVAQNAFSIAKYGLDRVQQGLPLETLERAEGHEDELIKTYAEIGVVELVQGFDLLLDASVVENTGEQLSILVTMTFAYNEYLGKKLLERWAEKLAPMLPHVQSSFFLTYSLLYTKGATSGWDESAQSNFIDGSKYLLPLVLNREVPMIVVSALKKFFKETYFATQSEEVRSAIAQSFFDQQNQQMGAISELMQELGLPLTPKIVSDLHKSVAREIHAHTRVDKTVDSDKVHQLIADNTIAERIIKYYANVVANTEHRVAVEHSMVDAMAKRLASKEWKYDYRDATKSEYDLSTAPICLEIVFDAQHKMQVTLYGHEDLQKILSWISEKTQIQLTKLNVRVLKLEEHNIESLQHASTNTIFPDETWLNRFLQTCDQINWTDDSRTEMQELLRQAVIRRGEWWGSRAAALLQAYSVHTRDDSHLHDFMSLLAELTSSAGRGELLQEFKQKLTAEIVKSQKEELRSYLSQVRLFTEQVSEVKFGFLERRLRFEVSAALALAKKVSDQINELLSSDLDPLSLIEEAVKLWEVTSEFLPLSRKILKVPRTSATNIRFAFTRTKLSKPNWVTLDKAFNRVQAVDDWYEDRIKIESVLNLTDVSFVSRQGFFRKMTKARAALLRKLPAQR